MPLALTDPQDSTDSTDYKDVYITSDDDYIYLRVTLYVPSDFTIFYNNIFIDADNDATTGYPVRGAGSGNADSERCWLSGKERCLQ